MKHFFKIFEWNTGFEFLQSMVPSIKLKMTLSTVFTGGVFGALSEAMGVQGTTVIAICVAMFAELVSGMYASIKRGENIRSGKFARFVVKAFVWLLMIFVVNAFCKEFAANKAPVLDTIMTWVRTAFLMTCFLEYMISINENMESITGKKSLFIKLLKEKVNTFITGEKETPDKADQID